MRTLKIKCDYCRKLFKRSIRNIKLNKKRNSKNYCSMICKNKSLVKNMSGENNPMHGVHRPQKTRDKISKTRKKLNLSIGKNNPNYKDGRTPKNKLERGSIKNKQFTSYILKRDGYTCQICGQRGGELHVDHIMPWSLYPKLRYKPENTRTLSKACHLKYGSSPHRNPPKWATSPINN